MQIGDRIGYLEITSFEGKTQAHVRMFCHGCSQPSPRLYRRCDVKKGNAKSCGCQTKKMRIQACLASKGAQSFSKGERFNHWELTEDYVPNRSRKVNAKCTACTKTVRLVKVDELRKNLSKSCGCMKASMISEGLTTKTDDEWQEILEKRKATNQKKYGFDWALQNAEVQQKIKDTCEERYGTDNVGKVPSFQEKAKETRIEKYGAPHVFQVPEIKAQVDATIQNRFGVINASKSSKIKQQKVSTSLKNFGTPHPMQSEEIRAKVATTLSSNGTVRTSRPQLLVFELLRTAGYCVSLNYPISRINVDMLVEVDAERIALEYDGGGHFCWDEDSVTEQRDIRRDKMVQKKGYRVFRIESRKDIIPTLMQVEKGIRKILQEKREFLRIKIS